VKIRERWEWILQFASDYRYIAHGSIIKRPVEDSDMDSSNNQILYPLAGSWVVRWQRSDQRGVDRNSLEAARINVYGNSFYFQGFLYHLNLGGEQEEEKRVHFLWPSYVGGCRQVAESGIDLRSSPHGPDIGETIVWSVNNPRFFRIFWVGITVRWQL
jgi:hypothetical protein